MDAPSSQEVPEVPAPRHLFFGVEDRRLGGRTGLNEKHIAVEKSRRHKLADDVINTAHQLASAVRTLRAFDRTGDAEMALGHLEHTMKDLKGYTLLLVKEVSASVDRYGDNIDLLTFHDAAEAATAPAVVEEPPAPKVTPLTVVRDAGIVLNIEKALDAAQRNRQAGTR